MSVSKSALVNYLSDRFRSRRDAMLMTMIADIHCVKGGVRLLDMGGRRAYWARIGTDWLISHGVEVTLFNLPSEVSDQPDDMVFRHQSGDACNTPFRDAEFDLVHSNSVIEHLGGGLNLDRFAGETRRVGRSYYVQTPYYWFPIDPHFYQVPGFHWLPRSVRAALVRRFALGSSGRSRDVTSSFARVDSAQLLSRSQMRRLFPTATIRDEKFAGLTKSMIAIYSPAT